ncbi:glutathione S-transferase family protein [Sphingosinicella terrae]|uniref:glutathione S-transferase family protein n=1 Tax=Sphingosinicella terrae TaxID=2172047 RepID=UPI000E0D8341|nr:glutathione S-transferase [Sphingosinicella terrae]
MIIVHHLENSRSQRILWLLEELGLPYEVQRYQRDRRTMLAPPELARVHPLGKAPVIEDTGAGPASEGRRVVAETGAIVEYLVEKAEGHLGPPANREAVLRYRHFLHYAEGSLMPPLFALLVVSRLGLLGRPARAPLLAMYARHLDWLERELADRAWFAGDEFSAADIMMSFPLEVSRDRAGLGAERPNLIDWLERIHARPAYAAALQKGGPYVYR